MDAAASSQKDIEVGRESHKGRGHSDDSAGHTFMNLEHREKV
jgi:hypothetical protein